jgi:ubiquinone/menaquinone biosynthesis C-methylase UbiE
LFILGVGEPARMSVMSPSVFDAAATQYDAARPSYPDALLNELEAGTGPLAGRIVLDWGAGTGIASRQLAARGATVASLDIGEQMLRMALARSPRSCCLLADGNQMPIRSASADLTTFAQSWHWFEPQAATAEVARVLKPGGFWAAWWNRAKADGQAWFEDYQQLLTSSCPGYCWQHFSAERMVPDWTGDQVRAAGPVQAAGVTVLRWTRRVSAEHWLTDEQSKSYFIELEPAVRESVLGQVAAILAGQFPDGQLEVPYITTLMLARKAG